MDSSFNFNPTLWFVCRLCRKMFPNTDQLKEHKLQFHLAHSQQVKAIIFEETCLSSEWNPSHTLNESYPEQKAIENDPNEYQRKPWNSSHNPYVRMKDLIPPTKVESSAPTPMHWIKYPESKTDPSIRLLPSASNAKKSGFIPPEKPPAAKHIKLKFQDVDLHISASETGIQLHINSDLSNKRNQQMELQVNEDLVNVSQLTPDCDLDPDSDLTQNQDQGQIQSQIQEQIQNESENQEQIEDPIDDYDYSDPVVIADHESPSDLELEPSENGEDNDNDNDNDNNIDNNIDNESLVRNEENDELNEAENPPTISENTFKPPRIRSENTRKTGWKKRATKVSADSTTFLCHICFTLLATKNGLKQHIKSHTLGKSFKCTEPECSASFKYRQSLERHLLIHGKVSSHSQKCSFCERSFRDQSSKDDHERTHTGVKPFKCHIPSCESSFHGKKALTMHIAEKHGLELGKQQFMCHACGASFGLQSRLDYHFRSKHCDEKPFKCEHEGCERAFKFNKLLLKHKRSHVKTD